ncbi:MAG: hypothetical protein Fur0034_13610 [Desulfuromonadia bacterium]
MRRIFAILTLLVLVTTATLWAEDTPPPPSAADAPKPPPFVKGREFAYRLVKGMNLAQALPKKPVESDLFAILSGERSRTVEAEDSYDPKRDQVTFRSFNVLGKFSGRGWLIGTSEKTSVNLRTIILRSGTYRVTLRGTRKGHLLSIGGKAFTADCDDSRLTDVEAGTVFLDAGPLTFSDILPPDGVIDMVRLTASPLPPIEPFNGWRPGDEITYGEAAEVAAMLMREDFNPPVDPTTPPVTTPLVGAISLPEGTTQTTATIYGRYVGPAWIRNGLTESTFDIPFTVPSAGFYSLELHFMGKRVSGAVDQRPFSRDSKDFLHWVEIGIHHLSAGGHTLTVTLPPMGGIDAIRITRRRISSTDLMGILGWKGDPAKRIPREDSERILKDLLSRYRPDRWL